MNTIAIIDLSQRIYSGMPVYPGDTAVEITSHRLITNHHAGTHIDAPIHLSDNRKRICDLPIETFHGVGCLIDGRGKKTIDYEDAFEDLVPSGAIVLIRTDWDAAYGTQDYFSFHPVITEGFSKFLIDREVKMLCLDTPSPDQAPYRIHRLLLGKGIPIAENLKDLRRLEGLTFKIVAFPLNIEAEASLARIVAIIE